jgi:hypothetical protein
MIMEFVQPCRYVPYSCHTVVDYLPCEFTVCFIVKPAVIPRIFFSISCGDAPRRLLDDVRARVEACGSLNGYNDVSRSEADVRLRAKAL